MLSITPIKTPPTTAPGIEPKPPSTAAGKAFNPSTRPTLEWMKVIGANSTPAQVATAAPLRQHAEQRHRRDRAGKSDPVIKPQNADEGEGEEPAQHHQVALGEVHDLGGLVDKDEAKRDQAVHAAERNAAHQLLNEVQHCRDPSPDAPAILFDRLCRTCVRAQLSLALN